MLKYLYSRVVFSEIPEQITLGISISGCRIRCYDCHSQELWQDKGTPLTKGELLRLVKQNKGITCLLLLGGEHDIPKLVELFKSVHGKLKTAWYCGLDSLIVEQREVLQYLDYIKLGHYDKDRGGLDCPTTNQRLYQLDHQADGTYWATDITFKLQHNDY